MKATIRVRMSQLDAHYGGNLVDGARILALFGDASTELCIRHDGDEGLLRAYESVDVLAPTHAGDFLEVEAELLKAGNTSRRMRFEARKVVRPGLILALLAVSFTTGIYQHITYRGFPYGPLKEMTAYLRGQAKSEDVILHSNKLSMLPAMYFDRDLPQSFIGDPPGSSTDTLPSATQQVLHIEAEADIRSAVKEAERVWYIIYQRSIDEYVQAGKSTHPDIDYLNSQFTLVSQETRDDLQILLFTKNP